jgi:DNA-binding SARP family transcriptional activator/lipopolysaccharide biosynthesis regulator YciM
MFAKLEIRLLGTFQVMRGAEPIPDTAWSRRNARTLFKFLLLSPNRRCHKEQALDLLWPDLEPAAAANNLHKTLFYLRRTLCPKASEARACPYVEFDGETVTLAFIGAVDVEAFEARAQAALTTADPAHYTAALDLYTGDLLPDDLYADWAIPRREALRQTYLMLLRQSGELYLARREYESAIAVWSHLLAAEPSDEAAHSALMRTYALNSQRHQALRQYHLCKQALANELDTDPLPETTALYSAILRGEVGPELTLTPAMPLAAPPHRLVGRETEMNALLAALEAMADGQPRLALIAGEAGLGKTRLAHELARRANERNLPVLIGRVYEPVGAIGELPLPYGPFVEALRRFLDSQNPDVRQRLIGPWQADLTHLLPELGGEITPSTLEPEAAKRRLFDAVAHLLNAIASVRPLLLIFDDLHAADRATLELLGYLLHRPPPFRVFVLAVAREEAISVANKLTPAPLTDLLVRVGRRGMLTRLPLTRLVPAETAQLVRDRLAGLVDATLTDAIHETSEGNPLFAEQLLQAWQEEGVLATEAGHWRAQFPSPPLPLPTSLRETIALRLGRLSSEAQAMLALAAVIGREFPYQWLQASGSWEEQTLLDLLDETLQAHVLEETSQRTGPLLYHFQHGLIRQTVYESLSEARRRRLHQRVAEALEGLADAPHSTLSYHWLAVGRWPWAFCHALTAADLARRAFAHAEAVSLYDRALAAIRDNWRPDDDLLTRVHVGRAQALLGLNRSSEAVTDLEWLVEQARASENRAAYGQAVSQLATAHFWGHNLEAARRLAQEALGIARETGDAMTAIMCTSNLGCIALSTGQLEQGTQHLEVVLEQVRAFGQPNYIVEALACLPGSYHWQGQSARSLPLLEEGITVARREGIGFWLGNLLFFAGLAHGSLCHYEQALDYFRQGQRHSQEAGDMFTAIRVANSLGWIHYELYDVRTALTYDRQGVEMARGFPWPEPLANALVNLGFDYLLTHELAEAERAFAEATTLLNQDVWMEWRWRTRLLLGQGWLALARQDLAQAQDHARQALALADETTARKNQARAHLLLGEIALAKGEATQATSFLHQAIDLAQAVDNPRLLWQSLEALARAKSAQGQQQAAAEAGARAAEVIQAIATGLQDEALRRLFLNAGPVQRVLQQVIARS